MTDHFTPVADGYAAFRPSYPDALFDWLAGLAPSRDLAWDCGAGSGQATAGLARHFARVIATDASAAQLARAPAIAQVEWRAAPAEASGLATGSVALVTVAQALHWFDLPRFHAEARRVLAPGGVLAAWTYGLFTTGDATVDALLDALAHDTLGPWWPPERRLLDEGYRTIDFPWPEVEAPPFAMRATWDASHVLGYLRTWSAAERHERATGTDAVTGIEGPLRDAWGDGAREVSWPLGMRVGRKGD